ncbi:MAG: hypothetical protein ACOCUI_03295 [bacterium]
MYKFDEKIRENEYLIDYVTVTFPVDKAEDYYKSKNESDLYSIFYNEYFQAFIQLLHLEFDECVD